MASDKLQHAGADVTLRAEPGQRFHVIGRRQHGARRPSQGPTPPSLPIRMSCIASKADARAP